MVAEIDCMVFTAVFTSISVISHMVAEKSATENIGYRRTQGDSAKAVYPLFFEAGLKLKKYLLDTLETTFLAQMIDSSSD